MLAFFFEQVARDDTFCPRCTSWFQRTRSAVCGACPVGHGSIISDQTAALQRFTARTSEAVGLIVELKIGPGKKAPGLPFSIQQRCESAPQWDPGPDRQLKTEKIGEFCGFMGSLSAPIGTLPNRRFLPVNQLVIRPRRRGPIVEPIHTVARRFGRLGRGGMQRCLIPPAPERPAPCQQKPNQPRRTQPSRVMSCPWNCLLRLPAWRCMGKLGQPHAGPEQNTIGMIRP